MGLLIMSSKNKLLFIVLGIVLVLISIKAGLALDEDFSAYGTAEEMYVCGCGTSSAPLIVENTGDTTSVYDLTVEGSAAAYASSTASTFSLKPGVWHIQAKYSLSSGNIFYSNIKTLNVGEVVA